MTALIYIMDTLPEISKEEKLFIELDFRLCNIWNRVEEIGWEKLDKRAIASLLRMTYAQGYTDALKEESAGQLLRDVPGFTIQGRKR